MDFSAAVVAYWLIPLAIWFVISGIDELVIDLASLLAYCRRRPSSQQCCAEVAEKKIAIFVPLWRESAVIERMLAHNVAAIRYRNYVFVAGAYPNDQPTIDAVRRAARRFPNIYLAVCPNPGPTSKADCLNAIYARMLAIEEERRDRFDIAVLHDAEDLIHPDALAIINAESDSYGMVQVPVLPLRTGLRDVTHSAYCDEFSEFQIRDMAARQFLGGFIPSCGVGTGFSRDALERLAQSQGGEPFLRESLTEDYDSGFRLKRFGVSQKFVPVRFANGEPIATREFFPRCFRHAVRQRTRWVTGIALQTWERYGCGNTWRERYWFWRDRKGLLGVPTAFAANLFTVYALGSWLCAPAVGGRWILAGIGQNPAAVRLFEATFAFQALRIAVRASCSARVYGWRFAAGAPVRMVWANWINFFAASSALLGYMRVRIRGGGLVWSKTEHAYPARESLAAHRRRLGEILPIAPDQLNAALREKPQSYRLGEYLVQCGKISERQLYQALSIQQNLAFDPLPPIAPAVRRALPAAVVREWKVLPFKIDRGELFLAGPEIPTPELDAKLRKHTRLKIRYQLITPTEFARRAEKL